MKPNDNLIVSSAEPTENKKKIWFEEDEINGNKIYVLNEDKTYKEFMKKELNATTTVAGLLSPEDKIKLNGLSNVVTAISKTANTWNKIGTISIPYGTTWREYHALIAIKGIHSSTYNKSGIAEIDVNTTNSSNIANKQFKFISKSSELDLNDFYIESKNATAEGENTVVNVWIRGTTAWRSL